jgi:WD40 repeat protein
MVAEMKKRGADMRRIGWWALAIMVSSVALLLIVREIKRPRPQDEFLPVREFDAPGPAFKEFTCAALSPDAKYVLLGYHVSRGERVARAETPLAFLRVLDGKTGDEIRTFPQYADHVHVKTLAFLPDSRRAAIGLSDGMVMLVDVTVGTVLWYEKTLQDVELVTVSADGTRLLAEGGGIEVWDVCTPKPSLVARRSNLSDGRRVRMSPIGFLNDNRRVLGAVTERGKVKSCIWDSVAGDIVQDIHADGYYPLAKSPDFSIILFRKNVTRWIETENFRVWDARGKAWIDPTRAGQQWTSPACTVGQKVEDGRSATYVRFWNVGTGEEVREVLIQRGTVLLVSPEGKHALVVGGSPKWIGLWDLDAGYARWQVTQ